MQQKSQRWAMVAVIAALYAVITIVTSPISYGPIQIRLSEVLKPAMFFFPFEGTVGLGLGLIVSNFFSPTGIADVLQAIPSIIIQGYLTRKLCKKLWHCAIVQPLIVGIWVGAYLSWAFGLPIAFIIPSVTAGEIVAISIIGVPLWYGIQKRMGLKRPE